MFAKKSIVCLAIVLFVAAAARCDDLENDWNDFLHYTLIGRLDLAEGYGRKIIDSDPDPEALLELSQSNTRGYKLLLKMFADSDELREVSGKIIDTIEKGRYIRRTNPKIILQEIKRLSTTIRGRIAAEERLKNAGEYAIPYMLDALADTSRKDEFSNIINAIPKIGRGAIRPLAAALQTDNVAVQAEVIRALGNIGYRQCLAYLKYTAENGYAEATRKLAAEAAAKIDSAGAKLPAAELFFQLGQAYYNHSESLDAAADYDFANIWFWDAKDVRLTRLEVARDYFNELMAMRCCEWALKADENMGKAVALWLAAYFKAESAGVDMPEYFPSGHADAMTYAMTSGPEYLHQALERALRDKNAYVALWSVEALGASAGESSLLFRVGTAQPLVEALSFDDRAVKYSAAIAIAQALPNSSFVGSKLIIENLTIALDPKKGTEDLGSELADVYAMRAVEVMLDLAITRNRVIDLSQGRDGLIDAVQSDWEQMQISAGQVLARLGSPDAQRAIGQMALAEKNSMKVKREAFDSLAISAKQNGNLLTDEQIDAVYSLVSDDSTDPDLRSRAAAAYGALNLPSRKVKDLILKQVKS